MKLVGKRTLITCGMAIALVVAHTFGMPVVDQIDMSDEQKISLSFEALAIAFMRLGMKKMAGGA